MLSLLRRYRELIVVGVLLVLPLFRFISAGGRAREPNFLDRTILAISSPIQGGLTWVLDSVGDGVHGYVALRGVYDDNERLKTELEVVKSQVHTLEEQRVENARLRRLLSYSEELIGQEILARVIGVNPVPSLLSVRLNKGEDDGIQRGMPVVTPDGIVGRVIQVTGQTADVLLLTDGNSRIAVRVQRADSRARATAKGGGGRSPLRLENALRTDTGTGESDFKDGDLLITSGTDSIFPPGLKVGTLTNLSKKNHGMFQSGEILPAVDVNKLDEVFVLTMGSFAVLPSAQASGTNTAPAETPP